MDFKLLIQSVKDACQNSPVLIVLGALALARARHRWK